MLLHLAVLGALAAPVQRKFKAGPPNEFSAMQVPVPHTRAHTAYFSRYDVSFSLDNANILSWERTIIVDSSSRVLFTLSFPAINEGVVSLLRLPEGTPVTLNKSTSDKIPVGSHSVDAQTWTLLNPQIGSYKVVVTLTAEAFRRTQKTPKAGAGLPDGLLIVYNDSPYYIFAHTADYSTLILGGKVGVRAAIADKSRGGRILGREEAQVTTADLQAILPNYTRQDVPMNDDGHGFDRLAGDNELAGHLDASIAGMYTIDAHIAGTVNGVAFERTATLLLPVTTNRATLTGKAILRPSACADIRCGLRSAIDIVVDAAKEGATFDVWTEVWGTANNGSGMVPVAWLGALATVTVGLGGPVVTLQLDSQWLIDADAKSPLQLRNLRLQCDQTHIPVASAASMPVFDPRSTVEATLSKSRSMKLPRDSIVMRNGIPPLRNTSADTHGLVLLHGYCSTANPWVDTVFGDDAHRFLDANANRPNNDFAELVAAYAGEKGLTSLAIVGHSQGGIIGATLLSSFFTGLDSLDLDGRLVQSVGTPYNGCAAAGHVADLGRVFGIGCGENSDMSLDGAGLWLATIPPAVRSNVWLYTTTYKLNNLFGDSCSLPMNLILDWPNDGVTERSNALLDGANDEGNTELWCHTTDMNYPPHYTDSVRNAKMTTNAAKPVSLRARRT